MNPAHQAVISLVSSFTASSILANMSAPPGQWVLAGVGILLTYGATSMISGFLRWRAARRMKSPNFSHGRLQKAPTGEKGVLILVPLVCVLAMWDLGFTLNACQFIGPDVEWNVFATPFAREGSAALALLKFVSLAFAFGLVLKASYDKTTERILYVLLAIHAGVLVYWIFWFVTLRILLSP